ncbi:MAG: hypothetical protein JSW37_06610, partial [Anaerolineales bacterium]
MSATSDPSRIPSRPSASQAGSLDGGLLAALVSTSKTAVLPREADNDPLPLSFAQERLWLV